MLGATPAGTWLLSCLVINHVPMNCNGCVMGMTGNKHRRHLHHLLVLDWNCKSSLEPRAIISLECPRQVCQLTKDNIKKKRKITGPHREELIYCLASYNVQSSLTTILQIEADPNLPFHGSIRSNPPKIKYLETARDTEHDHGFQTCFHLADLASIFTALL